MITLRDGRKVTEGTERALHYAVESDCSTLLIKPTHGKDYFTQMGYKNCRLVVYGHLRNVTPGEYDLTALFGEETK